MGVFTLTYSIGSLVAGLIAGKFDPENINQMPNLYLQISLFSIFSGIVIAILLPELRIGSLYFKNLAPRLRPRDKAFTLLHSKY